MSKQIATQDKELAALYAEMGFNPQEDGIGAGASVDKEDIVYGRIFLCQGNNPLIKERKAQEGDFLDSLNEEVLGEEVKMIFISDFKTWTIEDANSNTRETIAVIPHDSAEYYDGEKISYKGQPAKATITHNFYVLLVDSQDLVPYIFSLKRATGGPVAKKLKTAFSKEFTLNKRPSFEFVYQIGSEVTKSKDGLSYLRITAKKLDERPSITQIKTALEWAKIFKETGSSKSVSQLNRAETNSEEVPPPLDDDDIYIDANSFDE